MLRIPAPAKINIGLQIGSLMESGYHYLETFMQTVSVFDFVEIGLSEEFIFRVQGYDFPIGERNLCVIAYEKFCQAMNTYFPVEIKLQKNIPVGAGLGGGSSDAAAVLKGLNVLMNAGCSTDELTEIGSQIGADVPFFLKARRGAAICSGKGEVVEAYEPLWIGWVMLVFMGVSISTEEAYRALDDNLTNCQKNVNLKRYILSCFPVQKGLNGVENDFQEIVFRKYPVLNEVALYLKSQGSSYSSLSGSGSAVYGLFESEPQAMRALAEAPDWSYKVLARTPVPLHQ